MLNNKNMIQIIAAGLITSLLLNLFPVLNAQVVSAENHSEAAPDDSSQNHLETTIRDIVNWRKNQLDQPSKILLNKSFLENVGTSAVDWYAFGLGRAGLEDDYDSYLAVAEDTVEKKYQTEEKLSESKATEWHRIALAVLAAEGDPTQFGTNEKGESINLIADGIYNRGQDSRSLGTQGLNGWIWGLIALDSMHYQVPDDAKETRDDIITEIMQSQLEDGGFALNMYEEEFDVDLTAMAIQALAPYYNNEKTYTYEQTATQEKVTKSVREVIDESLELLSENQQTDGDYEMSGMRNTESTAQVVVALTELGINPLEDERFIKEGNTLLDALWKYKQTDGGFIHSETFDEENETADPDESNSMASEQVLYTLTALYRLQDGKRRLYDLRDEMPTENKGKVEAAEEAINALPENVKPENKSQVQKAFEVYEDVSPEERSYVTNYADLSNAMKKVNLDNSSDDLVEHMGENKGGTSSQINLFQPNPNQTESTDSSITQQDVEEMKKLTEKEASTEYYVDTVRFIDQLENGDKEFDEHLIDDLQEMKTEIEAQESEIEAINQLILNELYPYQTISKDDEPVVDEVIERYEALPAYDQEQVQGYEDVEKAATKIENKKRATYIAAGVVILCILLILILVIRHRKRKKVKQYQHMMAPED